MAGEYPDKVNSAIRKYKQFENIVVKSGTDRSSPRPWGVDNANPRFPVIRDKDGEAVCGGTYEYPMGTDDANLIAKAVNEYQHS